jgi:alkylation response protein AidB-like acyl-CoA dehydrogenase
MQQLTTLSLIPTLDLSSLRQFSREKILPHALERDKEGKFPLEIYRELHSLGFLHSFVPENLGGLGASVVDLAFMTRELGYASGGVAVSFLANCLGMGPILLYGNTELRQRVARDVLENFSLACFGMTEANAGTDIAHVQTRARRVPGGYIINGSKSYITNASHAKHIVVFGICDSADSKSSKLTAFYVPGDSKGLSRGKPMNKLGQSDSDTCELFFDELFVPEEYRLGGEGQGFRVAFHSLQRSKTLIGAASAGICDRAFDLSEQYLEERVRYGKPLLALPTIQNFLAQLHTEATAAWLLTLNAANTWDTGALAVKEASMAKLYGADLAVKVSNESLELMGAMGYTMECEAQRLYRDSKILEIIEGASFVQQVLIAKELFGDRLAKAGTVLKRVA